jgi:hypothetical protein
MRVLPSAEHASHIILPPSMRRITAVAPAPGGTSVATIAAGRANDTPALAVTVGAAPLRPSRLPRNSCNRKVQL